MAVPVSFLDGEVTLAAAPPWGETSDALDTSIRFNGSRDDHVVMATDPVRSGRTARTFRLPPMPKRWLGASWSTPTSRAPGPCRCASPVSTGCRWTWMRWWATGLLLLGDVDTGPGRPVADASVPDRLSRRVGPGPDDRGHRCPETDFERVLEETTPIVESLEIHPE